MSWAAISSTLSNKTSGLSLLSAAASAAGDADRAGIVAGKDEHRTINRIQLGVVEISVGDIDGSSG